MKVVAQTISFIFENYRYKQTILVYPMLKIVIIEDEERTLSAIKSIIDDYCDDTDIIGTARSINEALEVFNSCQPDVVLSDINLPDGTSFDLFNQLDETDFKIIFITAFEEYAIKAIKFSAFDYLVKPVNPKELIATIQNARLQLEKENAQLKLEALLANVNDFSKHLKKLVLKTSESIYVVDIQDIIRCESDSSYTSFFLLDKRKIMVSKVLKEYDELLQGSGFIRVHKSHLVNLNYIDRFNKAEGGYIVMKDGSDVPVSQRKRDKLLLLIESL